jgi:predicted nucleic acid-binding protein
MSVNNTNSKIYFDVCTLCRPFDDQAEMRVRMETSAFLLIMDKIKEGEYTAVLSEVHLAELYAIKQLWLRTEALLIAQKFEKVEVSDVTPLRDKAEALYFDGFGVADAAHLAYAEVIADFFVSCDDRLIRKSLKQQLQLVVLSPVEFVMRESLR